MNGGTGINRVVEKYLKEEDGDITYLRYMGVENGWIGLDFSGSRYDVESDDLVIQVSYKINIFRSNFFSNLGGAKKVVLTSTTKFWKE